MSEKPSTRSVLVAIAAVLACALLGAAAGRIHAAWAQQVARTNELLATVHRLEATLAARVAEAQPASQPGAVGANPGAPAAASEPSDPQALARANALLDAAHASKRWDGMDAQELRPLLAHLSDADRDSFLRRFAGEINHRQIQVDTQGLPPF